MDLYDNKIFVPMLLSEQKLPFNDKNYLFELKFDGIRTLIYVEPNKILIKNRSGIIVTDKYPELHNMKSIVKNKCIFDGEIVIMVDSKPSFSKLQERIMLKNKFRIQSMMQDFPVVFVCFDIIYENKDLTNLPLIKRKEILEKYPSTDYFVKINYIKESGASLFKKIKQLDLEGIVAKKTDSKYLINKRTKEWIKIKNLNVDEYLILAYKINKSTHIVSLLLGEFSNNKYKFIAKSKLSENSLDFKTISSLDKFSSNLNEEYIDYSFINPILKCRVEFLEKTKSGSLRHPVYRGLV